MQAANFVIGSASTKDSIMNHQRSKNNKRKGMRISIAFHSMIVLLAIIPFLVQEPDTQEFEQVILIELNPETFGDSGASGSSMSSSQSARKQVSMASLSKPAASTALQAPSSKPVITAPNPDLNIPEKETYFDDPLEVTESSETDVVQEVVEEVPVENSFDGWEVSDSEEASDAPAPMAGNGDGTGESLFRSIQDFDGDFGDGFKGDSESGDDPFADGHFDGTWPGETDGTEGKNLGAGKVGDGKYWGDFAGDGLFNRKVIQRADVARLAIKEGKLVVNLCVNQAGEVVYVKCDSDESTISDERIISLAESVAKNYVFEEDAAASSQQCGRLTFVFKIEQ
jgi:hypothetical protein